MEQSATAPAEPAANRKSARKIWVACICALGLQSNTVSVNADEVSSGFDRMPDYVRFALVGDDASQRAGFYYSPMLEIPVLKPAAPAPVRVRPSSKPKLAARTHERQNSRDLKPTILFGSMGKSVSLSPVSERWSRALGELQNDSPDASDGRHSYKAYSAILDRVKNHRRGLQIPKINYMVNRLLAYREDINLWKASEYWASPVETLARRAGDCEDYAILKYALLRDLGVEDKDMRIVVLRDTAARQYHAVLSVRHQGKWLILDNRFSRVRFERDLPHYQVLYTVNAAGEWSHTDQGSKPVRLAARLKAVTQ